MIETIASKRREFMASRFYCMLNCWHLSDRLGAELLIDWPDHVAHNPGDYAIGTILDVPATLAAFPEKRVSILESRSDAEWKARFADFAQIRAIPGVGSGRVDPEQLGALGPRIHVDVDRRITVPDETPAETLAAHAAIFARLRWSPEITASMAALDARIDLRRYVAIHIRRGDIVRVVTDTCFDPQAGSGERWVRLFWQRYVPIQAYVSALGRIGRPPVIVYSNDSGAAAAFLAIYDGEGVSADDLLGGVDASSPFARSCVEFLSIGRAGRVMGASGSGFSRLAADLAGATFDDLQAAATGEEIASDLRALFATGARNAAALRGLARHYHEQFERRRRTTDAAAIAPLIG